MAETRPNIILVITDDQGYGDLSCHGNPVIQTPNLDRLHGESTRFTQFHVGPTCAPTRAGLLTGRYCNCTGVWHTIAGRSLLRKDETTVADVLGSAGYRTGMFGKWHLGDNYPFRPHDRGFNETLYHRGGGVSQAPDHWRNDYFDDTYMRNGTPEKHEGYCTDVWFREAAKFIEANREGPFFCYLATNAPHGPLNVPEHCVEPYRATEPESRARFYGMIANIDENVGKLRAKLDELGLTENTVFVFMTDNGSADGCTLDGDGFVTDGYNAGMRGKKGSPYDGGHRVPVFVHWPDGGLTQGRDVSVLTGNIDMLPTLAELAGAQTPPEVHGKSLAPLLRGETSDWPARVLTTDSQRVEQPIKWRQSSVMNERWRLVNGKELYDIGADPEQRNDLADKHPNVIADLRKEYERWWELVSGRFDEEVPIIIGSPAEPETRLSSHDWHNEEANTPWNQGQVRQAMIATGHWALDVAQSGTYHFELCRWPREAEARLCDGIAEEAEEPLPEGIAPGAERLYVGGKALPVVSATVRLDGRRASRPVPEDAASAGFTFALPVGRVKLDARFVLEDGAEVGAYYVYVKRM